MIGAPLTAIRDRISHELHTRQRILLSSHARPDGDSIGSQLALAYALRALGKTVHVVNRDPAPTQFQTLPGVDEIEIAERIDGAYDAAVILECSQLVRTGVEGLERYFVINIDHHPANTRYGVLNWLDESAAACTEMVFDLVSALGVPLSREIATHVYVGILTDTGTFHHSHVSARTFDICRQVAAAGVDPIEVCQLVYHNSSIGKLKLTGALLDTMQMAGDGRLAVLFVDDALLRETGCAPDDLEGLINLPLNAREVRAVLFFKIIDGVARVSMRSKGAVDVRSIAAEFGGGGHVNAAGFTVNGSLDPIRDRLVTRVIQAIDTAEGA
jgi:phosphoesterase RecJ-like protein